MRKQRLRSQALFIFFKLLVNNKDEIILRLNAAKVVMVGKRSGGATKRQGGQHGGEASWWGEARSCRDTCECRPVAAESVGVRGGARLRSDPRINDHTSEHISCARASHSARDFHFSGRVFFSALLELARERSERSPQSIYGFARACVCVCNAMSRE